MAPNREIEIKLRVREPKGLVARLRNLGARKIACKFEQNTLFDTPDCQLQKRQSILRIRREHSVPSGAKSAQNRGRQEAPESLLTFKALPKGRGATGKYKEREEIECRVADAALFARLLDGLGMCPWFRYEKCRTKYQLARAPGLHIDLDETPIGVFLELEGPKRSIDQTAKALGYSPVDYVVQSYLELFRAECSRTGSAFTDMVFKAKKKR
jgi:adenylate cyclase, class 2